MATVSFTGRYPVGDVRITLQWEAERPIGPADFELLSEMVAPLRERLTPTGASGVALPPSPST